MKSMRTWRVFAEPVTYRIIGDSMGINKELWEILERIIGKIKSIAR